MRSSCPITTCSFAAILGAATACASAGTQTATIAPAEANQVNNEVLVMGNSDVVWDRLVAQVSRGFYVINNIDKASRLINLSFFTESPAEYVDCGTTTRTYTRGEEHQEYRYQFAEASSFKMGEKRSNQILTYEVNRKPKLEGRANIYVAPKDSAVTTVMVNARYVLTVDVTGVYQTESLIGIKGGTYPMDPSTVTISFSTNQPNKTNVGGNGESTFVTCYSRGKLEGEIIGFAKGGR